MQRRRLRLGKKGRRKDQSRPADWTCVYVYVLMLHTQDMGSRAGHEAPWRRMEPALPARPAVQQPQVSSSLLRGGAISCWTVGAVGTAGAVSLGIGGRCGLLVSLVPLGELLHLLQPPRVQRDAHPSYPCPVIAASLLLWPRLRLPDLLRAPGLVHRDAGRGRRCTCHVNTADALA